MADPIVSFYIQNYTENGSVVTTETLFQTIPIQGTPVITNPKVKQEIGKAGSFEFGLEMNSPFYNALRQMKTLMRVTLFGHEIFRGRVLTIDKTLARTRTVHCEGDFAFLLDSHQIGTKEETRPTIGVLAYLQQILAQHNEDMTGEPEKQFTLGEVPGQYVNADASQRVNIPDEKAQQQFGDSGYNTSMDRLEGLLSDFGGYFRTRHDPSTGITYLDWFDKYYNATTNTQTIEVTKNLIDLSGSTEVANLFTVIVPIGKSTESENVYIGDYWPVVQSSHAKVNYITVPELATIPLYSDAELNSNYHHKSDYQNAITRFGKIWKTVDFENANTPEKLFAYAKDWIKNNYMPEVTQWDVSAIDMKFVDGQNQVLLCGDRVNMIHPEVDQTYNGMTVISVDYDLYSPEKTRYTIGIPNQEINSSYGVKNKVAKSTGTKKSGKSGGSGRSSNNESDNEPENPGRDNEAIKERMQSMYAMKSQWGMDIYLDDPLAFTLYNNWGEELDEQHAQQKAMHAAKQMSITKATKRAELEAEAAIRGCAWDDTQLVIDFTPSLASTQESWRQSYISHMVSIGVPQEEAEILARETAGRSLYASLVDDDGNWTQKAYDMNVPYEIGAEEVRAGAIEVRKKLSGKNDSLATKAVRGIQDVLGAFGINIDNYVSFDSNGSPSFKIGENKSGELFNTQDIVDSVSGLATQGVDMLNGSVSVEDTINSVTESVTKTFDMFGGLFNVEDFSSMISDAASKGVSVIGGLFNAESITNGLTGLGESVINMFNGWLSGSDTEKSATGGGGTWYEKYFNWGNILTGGNKEDGGTKFNLESDTAQVDGENGSAALGAGGSMGGWQITLNKPITYTVDGETYTVPVKTVAADDFHFTAKYDSLRAKLLVVDNLLADYAQIGTLTAMKADIDNITGTTIIADTRLMAAVGRFTNFYADNIYYQDQNGNVRANLSSCFSGAYFTEGTGADAGKIFLTLQRIDEGSSTDLVINFNIASTAKYIADVAAARSAGRGDVYVHDISISAGDSNTYNLKYTNPSTGTEMNTGATFRVTAGSGTVVDDDDIQIGSYGSRSNGTPAINMKNAILQAIDRGSWFSFEVTVDGTSASKTYSLNFT